MNSFENDNKNMGYHYSRKGYWIAKGFKIILLVALAGTVMSYVIMLLWNWLMPGIFGAGIISFWEALGLLVLAKILFGFGRWGGGYWGHREYYWKEKMQERLKNMTPEERERFRSEWRRRCGGWKHYGWEEENKDTGEVKA